MHPIELCSLTKRFLTSEKNKDEITILKDLNLVIKAGQSTAIIGKSGSGKSTLLNIAGGLDCPTEGKVLCNGVDFSTLDDKRKSELRNTHIGFIFQANLLFEDFTALENVMSPAMISGKKKSQCIQRAMELLQKLGLEDRMDYFPAKLSGGEKQRVAICRALMNNPSVILADEPTGALDEENASQVEDILLKIAKDEGKSLLLVTHNQDFAMRCDNVYCLTKGSLVQLKGHNE